MSAATVLRIATGEVGVKEDPAGSNRGARVETFQAATAYARYQRTGWPWCGAFVEWVWRQAGVETDACSASTEQMWLLAKARGWLSETPMVGCAILWRGVHTGIVVGIRDGVVDTVEGNSGDAVTRRTHRIGTGESFVIPPTIRRTAGNVGRVFWLEDTAAGRLSRTVGPWRTLAMAKRRLEAMEPAKRRRARIKRIPGGRWVIVIGPLPVRGPWSQEADRKRAQDRLEATLGRRLRPYSTPATTVAANPSGAVTGLGKTT